MQATDSGEAWNSDKENSEAKRREGEAGVLAQLSPSRWKKGCQDPPWHKTESLVIRTGRPAIKHCQTTRAPMDKASGWNKREVLRKELYLVDSKHL